MEGRVQRVRAAIDPPGEARQGWQVLAELLQRLGMPASYRSASAVFQEIAQTLPAYASMSYDALETGKSQRALAALDAKEVSVQMSEVKGLASKEYPKILLQSGAFDWGSDPLVSNSPTLRRDFDLKRKLFPGGLVEMSSSDADEIGVKQGWKIKMTSTRGEVALPVSLRTDIAPGVMLLPFAFREHAFSVTGGEKAVAIHVERA